MSKRTILTWWIGGLAALVPAAVLLPSSGVALLAHLDQVQHGPGYHLLDDRYAVAMLILLAIGVVFAVAWLVAALVAWVGAVLNARQLDHDPWFTVVLVGGLAALATIPLLGLGTVILFGLMTAYLVAAPDGTAPVPSPTTPGKPTITKWAGRGFTVAGVGVLVALAASRLTGPGQLLHDATWPALAVVSVGIAGIAVGAIIVSAAWWGALFNAHTLADQTWFHRMLWTGTAAMVVMPLLGLGALILAVIMIAYGRSAPDGLTQPPATLPPAPRTAALDDSHRDMTRTTRSDSSSPSR